MSRTVELIDTTIRDGNQSLWGGTGLTTQDVLAIAPSIDRVGYHALDFSSSTHLAISVRYHREDPWERLRLTAAAMPSTRLTFLTTGTRFISWKPCTAEVLELAFRCAVRNGLRRFQLMHPTNDPAALIDMARLARRVGAEEIVLALAYSVSPVHDDEHYGQRIRALAQSEDADRFYLKDPGGLLVPARVRSLVGLLGAAAGDRPVEVHSHCTTSLAPLVYVEGVRAGAAAVHTAARPLASGTSQPSAEGTIRNLRAAGFTVDVNEQALARCSQYFTDLAHQKNLPTGVMPEYDESYYRHQLPGGMATTMRRQLDEMRRPELFDAALEEVTRVRAEFGYPIMVTPLSQFVATQAVMNVLGGERYSQVPDEVVRYLLGQFGPPAAPPDPEVSDRVLSLPRAHELRDVEPLSLDGARDRFPRVSDEELLLRLTMPAEQVDAMLSGAKAETHPAPGARAGQAPVVKLLRELDRRREITYLHLRTEEDELEWRRDAAG